MNKKTFFLITIFSLSFILSVAQVKVKISDQTLNLNGKKYYLHKVEPGQTLYSVSKAYKVNQEEIKTINELETYEIKAGQILKIPFKKQEKEHISPDFFYHKVIKGETLFSLTQKYYVSAEEIIQYNPDVKYGLKAGQILKIPNSFKKNKEQDENTLPENITIYTVEEGNTLFSISRKFNINIEDIIKLNPGSENGIKAGQKLKIPKQKSNETQNNATDETALNTGLNDPLYFTVPGISPCNDFKYEKGKTFNIVLLLPLFLEENLNYISRYEKEKDPMFYKNTKKFTEFYEGAILAFEKLKKQGLSLNIKVFDTENNKIKVRNIMSSLDYPNIDLIIGPVYSGNVKIAAEFAKEHKVNLISPLSRKSELLENNPFVFQATPSAEAGTDKVAEKLSKQDSVNLILVYDGSDKQKKLIERFKKTYTANDTLNILSDTSVMKIIKYDADIKKMDEMLEITKKSLKKSYKNIVYIPSDNEVLVTQIADKYYAAINEENPFKVILIGSDRWVNFQNFNSDYFKKMDFVFISPFYIDYDSFKVKKFLKKYRTVYKTEPGKYAYTGYDITYYFINALRKYGRIFQFCLSPDDAFPDADGIIYDFNFKRTGIYNGFENKNLFILEFDETFKLKEKEFKK